MRHAGGGTAAGRPEVTVIQPSRGFAWPDPAELWRYRELLYFLAWRDVKVRYKQTALGAAWAVIQPAAQMLLFTALFGRLARLPSDGAPYALFAYAGLVPWTYFAGALHQAGNSLVTNRQLVEKVWFPRLLVPLASTAAGLVDLLVASLLLPPLLLWHGRVPGVRIAALPLFVALAALAAAAAGVWLAALNVRYRDVRYTIPFLAQLWMFATPVVYPASLVPPAWRALYALNPMVGVVEGFRWCLIPGTPAPGSLAVISAAAGTALLLSGVLYFQRVERTFADVV
ncbi:MAG: ABC transporter permease [Acidobacteria bacterium]|nr:MAG: ABC transporter permease [Acidobacteriota bacterium]